MTDAERRIREKYRGLQGNMPPFGDVITLLMVLDEERQRWLDCAMVDATMEGPRLKGWNRSALDRLWRMDRYPDGIALTSISHPGHTGDASCFCGGDFCGPDKGGDQ